MNKYIRELLIAVLVIGLFAGGYYLGSFKTKQTLESDNQSKLSSLQSQLTESQNREQIANSMRDSAQDQVSKLQAQINNQPQVVYQQQRQPVSCSSYTWGVDSSYTSTNCY